MDDNTAITICVCALAVLFIAIAAACADTSIKNNRGNNAAEIARAEHCQVTVAP